MKQKDYFISLCREYMQVLEALGMKTKYLLMQYHLF